MSRRIYGGIQLRDAQEIAFYDANSSNFSAFKAPAALTADVTFTLPDGDSTGTQALVSNGSGVLSWASFANQALSNLAAVAINTSLVSDTNNTDNLGSAAIGWAAGYINIIHLDSNSQTTTLQGSAAASASVTYSLPPADGTSGFVLSTNGSGVLSWVSNVAVSSFKDDWETADGTTFAITHNLGTKDVKVEIYDKTDDQTIQVDTVTRTSINVVTLTASTAPGASGWRVMILAV